MTLRRKIALSLPVILFVTGCTTTMPSQNLFLEAHPTETQVLRQGATETVTISNKFHSVAVSPHAMLAPDQDWRFYIRITNRSALDMPFEPKQIAVFRNGSPLTPLSRETIQRRILDARAEALKEIGSRPDPVRASRRDLKDEDQSDWSASAYVKDMRRYEADTAEQKREVETLTRRKLADLDAHALEAKTLRPGESYETFVEIPNPKALRSGDEIVLRVAVEPDVHDFHYRIGTL